MDNKKIAYSMVILIYWAIIENSPIRYFFGTNAVEIITLALFRPIMNEIAGGILMASLVFNLVFYDFTIYGPVTELMKIRLVDPRIPEWYFNKYFILGFGFITMSFACYVGYWAISKQLEKIGFYDRILNAFPLG